MVESSSTSSPKINYVYFNRRGRGELARLVLNAADVQYSEKRVDDNEWPSLKPQTPFGTLPYIEIDGCKFSEGLPIARYLSRKYNLMGKTELEQLQSDIILNLISEAKEDVLRWKNDKLLNEEQRRRVKEKWRNEVIPKLSERVEQILTENRTGFVIGRDLTLGDLAVLDIYDQALKEIPEILNRYPKIKEHRQKITALPKIAKYLSKRPDTPI